MRITPLVATGTVLLALPASALAVGPPTSHPTGSDNPGVAHRPATVTVPAPPAQASPVAGGQLPTTGADGATPGPTASPAAKAKAYGRACKAESKKRVAGAKGTPFSLCVTALAKVASGQTRSPRIACKDQSKKRVAGAKGTPFSLCVSAAAKQLRQQDAETPAPEPAPVG
ncbi:hypothetical protein [Patulibacter defluvii]|uniref:hypothetical protein n=1 Tax=Patulibacter defluvii TaxID=3095358 RepID=UPI002A75CB45|nr:hypothetical protein [Patulibacter sp. DM4]